MDREGEMEPMIDGHLGVERVSALLDEPWADRAGERHLEQCEACQAEFERLSRMRMALSALGDEDPPAGQWRAIEAALDATGPGSSALPLPLRIARRFMTSAQLQAAAALVLFAGGVLAGLQLTGVGTAVEDDGNPVPAVIGASGDDRALFDGLTQLESLRSSPLRQAGMGAQDIDRRDGSLQEADGDVLAATRELAKLEGIIRAMRDRLDANPRDQLASAVLLDVVEQRDQLTEAIERSMRTRGTVTW